jgi:predicted permease
MRFLDTTNKLLQYSREASFLFFWIHHPVTFFTAFYILQSDMIIPIKMLVVGVGSFVISLGLYELLVRRINPVRAMFGMKPRKT